MGARGFFEVMKKIKKIFTFYALPLLSSALMGLSYIPFPPWALFFCYVPLWLFALRQKRLKPLLTGAWICQFFGVLIGFNWVAYTIREFGLFPWPVAILGLLAFASFTNLHIPIALGFWFFSRKWFEKIKNGCAREFCVFLSLPLYCALCMQYYPMIFEWHFGYTWLYAGWPAFQTAEIWGFWFLNTLTLFFNLFFLLFVLKWDRGFITKLQYRQIRTWRMIGVWAVIFATLNVYGWRLERQVPKPDKEARVLMVQANIENPVKAYKKSKRDPRPLALFKLRAETQKHFYGWGQKPDFIIWPEGAYPYSIQHDGQTAQNNYGQKQARNLQTPIVMSATAEGPGGETNSVFVFNERGDMVQPPYDKTLLLAFGEYLPGEKWFPVKKLLPYYNRSFSRGTGEYKTINLNGVNLGFQICYEGLFDFFTRDLALEGAQILVNVTNDSWYGDWQEPYQHLYMTLGRAIEVRRPLIRVTNTGFSAFISARGKVGPVSDLNTQTSWIQSAPYYSVGKQTIFSRWGFYINSVFLWGLWACLFGACALYRFFQ